MSDHPQDTTEAPQNLVSALQEANAESRAFIVHLEETAEVIAKSSIDDDPGLSISKSVHQELIRRAEVAIASGDVIAIMEAAAAYGIGESDDV